MDRSLLTVKAQECLVKYAQSEDRYFNFKHYPSFNRLY
jgi:hypothetical protein